MLCLSGILFPIPGSLLSIFQFRVMALRIWFELPLYVRIMRVSLLSSSLVDV